MVHSFRWWRKYPIRSPRSIPVLMIAQAPRPAQLKHPVARQFAGRGPLVQQAGKLAQGDGAGRMERLAIGDADHGAEPGGLDLDKADELGPGEHGARAAALGAELAPIGEE